MCTSGQRTTQALGSDFLVHSPGLPTPPIARRHFLLQSPRCSRQLSSDTPGFSCSSTTSPFQMKLIEPLPLIPIHTPAKAANLPSLLTAGSWDMRSLSPCLFVPMSPSCVWKIMLRGKILLLLPWETVPCSRIWGTGWQVANCLGQNMYKDDSSCSTTGQTGKQTSVLLIYFPFLLFFSSSWQCNSPC